MPYVPLAMTVIPVCVLHQKEIKATKQKYTEASPEFVLVKRGAHVEVHLRIEGVKWT